MAWTNNNSDSKVNYPLTINPNINIDIIKVVKTIAQDFSEFMPQLANMCTSIVREVSYILFELKIKHTVTIGDVKTTNNYYLGINENDIKNDLKKGYQYHINEEGVPIVEIINIHAWITLENGQIIDPTILSTLNKNYSQLSFEDAIYYSGKNDTPVIKHVPLMTGFAYHIQCLTHPIDNFYPIYIQWYIQFFTVIDCLETSLISKK